MIRHSVIICIIVRYSFTSSQIHVYLTQINETWRDKMEKQLREATSICTMSHESVADQRAYQSAVFCAAARVRAGLLTFDEAKRAIFAAWLQPNNTNHGEGDV